MFTCVYPCMHMYVRLIWRPDSAVRCLPQLLLHSIFEDRISLWPWCPLIWLDWLVSMPQGSSCVLPLALGFSVNAGMPSFLHGCWDSALSSSCLLSKHLTHWTIFQAPENNGCTVCWSFKLLLLPGQLSY